MLRELRMKELKKLYRTKLMKDFHREELLSFSTLKKTMRKGIQKIFLYKQEVNQPNCAYFVVSEIDDYIFIHYLAVYPQYRGRGIGSKLLQDIIKQYQDKKVIILEVEDPKFAKNKKEEEIQNRRIAFYKKNDFLLIRELKETLNNVNYAIMIKQYQAKSIEIQEIKRVIEKVYNKFLRSKANKKYFNIRIEEDNK